MRLSLGAVFKASYLEHLGLSFSRFGRFSNDISNNNAIEMCKDEKTKTLILKYLESVDFSIKKIEIIPKNRSYSRKKAFDPKQNND